MNSYKFVFKGSNEDEEIRALNKIRKISDFRFTKIDCSTYEIEINKLTVLDLIRYIIKQEINKDLKIFKINDR